jgi:hypothetical protein
MKLVVKKGDLGNNNPTNKPNTPAKKSKIVP